MKSILSNEKRCYLCGRQTELERHHIFAGFANRRISEANGFWVYLDSRCHRGVEGAQYNRETGDYLKRMAQRAYEQTHSREEWMRLIMKNYLLEDDDGEGLP